MDLNMTISKRYILIIAAIFLVSLDLMAGERRSQTEAASIATCPECMTAAAYSNRQFSDFKAINVAIFDADPTTPELDDPRIEMNLTENPQLRAISVVRVTADLAKAPHVEPSKTAHFENSGAGRYKTSGTSFMINECLMLTNYHVANVHSDEKDISNRTVEVFSRDQSMDGTFGTPIKSYGTVVANDPNRDLSVIKMDRNRRDKKGIIPVCYATEELAIKASNAGKISSASFFTDKGAEESGVLFGQKGCKIYGKTEGDLWRTNCPTLDGSSGSPVFATGPSGICAIGVLSGSTVSGAEAKAPNTSTFNYIVPFSDPKIKDYIQKIIHDNPCVDTTRT